MKKASFTFLVSAAFAISGFAFSAVANAQVAETTSVFYNQAGQAVNPNGTLEPAGYYYNSSGQQIYYYGNGTSYNPETGTYGGQAFGTFGSPVVAGVSTSIFYNQSGQAINSSGTSEPAGYYYLSNGNQVYYYGNGTYYDTATETYGGMIFRGTVATASGSTLIFYNQSGQAINSSGTSEPAGYYYLSNGNQVYYYGNGTYYDTATETYGGMIFG